MAHTFVIIQVYPSDEPTELDVALQPLSVAEVESDEFLIALLREHMKPQDLLYLRAACLVTEDLSEKIEEARKLTKGAYGVLVPFPANIYVPVPKNFFLTLLFSQSEFV